MSITINESGMTFGPFSEDDFFDIEKILHKNPIGKGVCKVEFVVLTNNSKVNYSVVFVEAKSSIPREFNKFFENIYIKMIHSITVWFTIVCGRHSQFNDYLPKNFNDLKCVRLPIKLILVIPSAPDEALSPLTDKFRQYFIIEKKIWAINYENIRVVNRSRATQLGLA